MKKFCPVLCILIFSLLLGSCNLPEEAEPTVDIVGTQVSRLLTASATEPIPTTTEQALQTLTETEVIEEASHTPTASETLTPSPSPTITQAQDDPAQKLGAPVWTQDFSGNSSPWDFDYTQAEFRTESGFLSLTARANANWHSWYVSSPKLQNAYVETTITMSACSGLDRFGLAVRADSEGQQFYFMGITCDGRWGFFRMAPDVNISEIIGFRAADPLSSGMDSPHRVGIWMEGSSFTFYIDGKEVGSATDTTLTNEGFTGFLIAYANTPGFTVRVDELKYWNVP